MKKIDTKKSEKYRRLYQSEFTINPNGQLFCSLCFSVVNNEKKYYVDQHRNSAKHINLLKNDNKPKIVLHQTFLNNSGENKLLDLFVLAFASTSTPLHRLRNPHMKKLFSYLNAPLPSESQARLHIVGPLATKNNNFLVNHLSDQKLYIVIDESEINGHKYCNILAGRLTEPNINYIIDVVQLEANQNMTSTLTLSFLKNALDKYNITHDNVILIISDAASYMIKAIREFKSIYNNCFHVLCLAHLIHNCSMIIRANFNNVDKLIGSIKAITIKNKNNMAFFSEIGLPPKVIVTRWSSWLRAVDYYCVNLPSIKNILNKISTDGILIQNAKNAIENNTLINDLITIKRCYSSTLIPILDLLEANSLNIRTSIEMINQLNFEFDTLQLKEYLNKRLRENDITSIHTLSNPMISPVEYMLLLECIPTSVSVERSFSMLKKLLVKDRNFDSNNIYSYFAFYYNSNNENYLNKETME